MFRLIFAALVVAGMSLVATPPAYAHGGRVFVRGSGVVVQSGGNVVVQRRGLFGRRSTVIVNGHGIPAQSFGSLGHGGVIFVR